MAQKDDPSDLTAKQEQLICALLTAPSKVQAAVLAGVPRRTMYRWFHDEAFLAAYHEARRHLFDDMMATIDKAGNLAALALVEELHRAEEAGGASS